MNDIYKPPQTAPTQVTSQNKDLEERTAEASILPAREYSLQRDADTYAATPETAR